jgi:hypothetical protein
MKIFHINDGDYVDKKHLLAEGFILDENRDFSTSSYQSNEIESLSRISFVGFTSNEKNEILTVFPKKYIPTLNDIESDNKKIFSVIFKHIQQNPDMYLGDELNKHINSNYPFAAFFSIYNYYKNYGLYFKESFITKPSGSGKIDWKESIKLSDKYIIDDKFFMFPFYHQSKNRINTFLTHCMIFIIDYTIDKFNFIINQNKTEKPFPEFDFINNKEFVLETLYKIRNKTFNDIHIHLVDNIINFFQRITSINKYFLKHYSFHSIWESMVFNYLNCFFLEFSDDKMVFSKYILKNDFSKPSFFPNIANNKNFFQPDFYLVQNSNQIILDAKYYDVQNLDYKQIAYILFLINKRQSIENDPLFNNTYSALIIPDSIDSCKVHFQMDPLYNKECSNFKILEQRLDIRKIIDFWINIY